MIGRVLELFNVSEADARVQAAMIGYLWYRKPPVKTIAPQFWIAA
jgi:hypothetical protein